MKRKITTVSILIIALLMSFLTVPEVSVVKAAETIELSGSAHIQTFADQKGKIIKTDGVDTLVLGTRGLGKRLENIAIAFSNNTGYTGSLQYRVHVQSYGWTNWENAGKTAGTKGQGKRLEGIQIRLTGEIAKYYDVRYCAHIQTYGDNQGWVFNGALAGTTGEAKRLEEIRVQVVPKKSITLKPSVSYRVHRQTYGWEKGWKKDGDISGTTGEAKRLEGITITVNDNQYNGGITYRTHVQSYGWRDWVSNGEMSGTQGQAKRLESIQIKLTGELAFYYDVYYQVHVQSYGWTGWQKNGASAGTQGQAKRLEAIRICLVQKNGTPPPSAAGNPSQGNNYNGGSDNCSHVWEENKVHFDAVTEPEYWLTGRDHFPHAWCNGCDSDTLILNDDPYDCPYCVSSGWGGNFSCTTDEPYVYVWDKTIRPAYDLVESYTCKKCGKKIENTSDAEKIQELRKQGHMHSWTLVYGEHHDSMVLGGRADDIFSSDECAKCGMSFGTFFKTTTAQTYSNNLFYWNIDYTNGKGHTYKTAGTNGLNEDAINHLKKCYNTDKIYVYSYDEVTAFKCKTCGQTKPCEDKDIECTMAEKWLNNLIELYKKQIIESGDVLPIDFGQVERDEDYELVNGSVYFYTTLNGQKEYVYKFVNGEVVFDHKIYVNSIIREGTATLMRGDEKIYTFRYDPYAWSEYGSQASLSDAYSVSKDDIIKEYVRYVHVGDLIYKYSVVDGELGELLQIYDKYYEPIN